jgi:methionyl-tRNA formyltransferase
LMQMDSGLDTGPMLQTALLPIAPDDTTATLTVKLASSGAQLLVQTLAQLMISRAPLSPTAQPQSGVTYAHKLEKEESWLDWRLPAARLAAQVRAFDPFPVAGARVPAAEPWSLRIWRAFAEQDYALPAGIEPGTLLSVDPQGIRVATGAGCLVLTEMQRSGGKRLAAREFLAGAPLRPGLVFLPRPEKALDAQS